VIPPGFWRDFFCLAVATNLTSRPNEIINKFNQHLIGHLGFKALRLSNQAPLESNQNAIAQAGSFAG